MIHFLRDKGNKTIVDIEAMDKDISCSINIFNYSTFLLNIPVGKRLIFASDIDAISEIRGEWFETKHPHENTTDKLAEKRCKQLSEKWNLRYVVD
jgi:predicted lipase